MYAFEDFSLKEKQTINADRKKCVYSKTEK